MIVDNRFTEIEHPAWPEPLVIEIEEDDSVFEVEEGEAGRVTLRRAERPQ